MPTYTYLNLCPIHNQSTYLPNDPQPINLPIHNLPSNYLANQLLPIHNLCIYLPTYLSTTYLPTLCLPKTNLLTTYLPTINLPTTNQPTYLPTYITYVFTCVWGGFNSISLIFMIRTSSKLTNNLDHNSIFSND